MIHFKLIAVLLIFMVTAVAGVLPFYKKHGAKRFDFPAGEAIACGVFLGAGLIHMLGDAASGFAAAGYQYPFAFLIAGISFLTLLWLEHVGQELEAHHEGTSASMAILAVVMLSIHSLLEGAAVGISSNLLTVVVLACAILAHKWAASFSLAMQINKSPLGFNVGLLLFVTFVVMTPIGILLGDAILHGMGNYPLLTPIFSALAAGTFLYIGTLHGLRRATMIERCCNMREFSLMLLGFGLMAVVAIWT